MASVTQGGIDLIIWTIVFTLLDIVFVLLRFYAARLIGRGLLADDHFILVALASVLALDGVVVWAVFYGHIGNRTGDLGPEEITIALKTIPAAYVTWTTATAAFKLSVLLFYRRVFAIKTVKILSWVLMGLTVAYWVAFLAVFLTTCTPNISQLWAPVPGGFCRDLNVGQLGSVSTNLALDVFVIILPMPFLWGLQMRTRNKLAVTAIFSLGFITIGIMIWRIVDLVETKNGDFIYHEPTLALTTTLELWLCIIIACVPTLGPVAKKHVAPTIARMTTRLSSGGTPKNNPRSIVTFGRLGGRTPKNNYANMTYGSQERLDDEDHLESGYDWDSPKYRVDARTATNITSNTRGAGQELQTLSPPNAIHVQQRIQTHESPRFGQAI